MTQPTDSGTTPPLDASDPRLSEWLDGRLPAAEAAAVERAVAGSAALARLVADLRAIKEAARLAPAASPPAGFVDRVMDAVAAAPVAAAGDVESDLAVEREWRALEAKRLAEERAEAEADLVTQAAPTGPAAGRMWPWLAIGSALAAGLLVTVLINRPDDHPRQIAQVTARLTEKAAPAAGEAGVDLEPPAPAAAPVAAAGAPAAPTATDEALAAADLPPAGQLARARALTPPKPKLANDNGTASESIEAEAAAGRPAQDRTGREKAAEEARGMAAAPGAAELRRSAAAEGQEAAAVPRADEARERGPVVVKVASWTDFDRLLEAHELEAKPLESDGESADRAGSWQLEVSGSSAAIEAFLAAATASRRAEAGDAARADAGDFGAQAAKQTDALAANAAVSDKAAPSDAAALKRAEAARKPPQEPPGKLVVILQIEPAGGGAKPAARPAPAAEKGAEP